MSKSEIVRLVSRALAVIQFVNALAEISYLPMRLFSAHHYGFPDRMLGQTYFATLYSLDVGFLFGRIALYLALAWVFWECGPRIANLLLPPDGENGAMRMESAEPGLRRPGTPA